MDPMNPRAATIRPATLVLSAALALVFTMTAGAQDAPAAAPPAQDPNARLDRLEEENAELKRRVDVLAGELEEERLGAVIAPLSEGEHGLGPAASKVYGADQGVTLGGYGELLFENFQGGGKRDQLDFLRAVLYAGYKFNEDWLFNSEIEFEHAEAGEGKGGEVALEFAYLDRIWKPELNARAGLLLIPMGFLNELHEPTTFVSAKRPGIERVILPTTWRENGAGVWGEAGDLRYRTYVVNGFDATGFSAGGLRDGRQSGGQTLAEDLAWTGRLDWVAADELSLGVSAWYGNSGQDQSGVPDVATAIWDAHAEWRWRGFQARGLFAHAELDDVDDLNASLGLAGNQSVGEELEGWYVELGYDVLAALRPGTRQSLVPFVRWETYDTQAEVPSGFSSNPANDVEIATFGVAYKPFDQVVFKLDYQDVDNDAGTGQDQVNLALGYIF
jgi:hypothetical protein